MTHTDRIILLARAAVACNVCFDGSPAARAGIGMAQPFTVGAGYRPGGVIVVGINPGAAADGGYKEARKQALDRFRAGDDDALTEYWSALASDADRFWNPRYLLRLQRLGLDLDRIAVGNIALCASAGNNPPSVMLQTCWTRHSSHMIAALDPGTVILMGSKVKAFEAVLGARIPGRMVIHMAHFAHREGHAYEEAECARVRSELDSVRPAS